MRARIVIVVFFLFFTAKSQGFRFGLAARQRMARKRRETLAKKSGEDSRSGPVKRMDSSLSDMQEEYRSHFDYEDFWASEEGVEDTFDYYKTAEGYKEVNGALREVEGDLDDTEYEFQDMMKLMDGQFDRDEADISGEDITVFRSFAPYGEIQEALENDELVGLEFQDFGFTSTTIDEDFAEQWGDEDNLLAEFKIPPPSKGVYLESLTDVGESEWLLPRGLNFRIVDAYDNFGRTSVVLEIVE